MDVSDIFNFFLLGGGEGESEAPGGGGAFFLIENPTRGGGFPGGKGPRGREGIGEFWGGGGLNIFFRGRNVHQVGVVRAPIAIINFAPTPSKKSLNLYRI